MTALAELHLQAKELAIVSHALGTAVQGHDLRLACVEAAAAALALRSGSPAAAVAAASAGLARCHREMEARVKLWARQDPDACRQAIEAADARIAAEIARLEAQP